MEFNMLTIIELVRNSEIEKLEELIKVGLDLKDYPIASFLDMSIKYPDELIVFLFQNKVDITDYLEDSLCMAVMDNDLDRVKFFVNNGLDLKKINNKSLKTSIRFGYSDITNYLKENGVNL